MAYEVVKRVGERAYRYHVESYRDPATGRARGRWTYLGRVEGTQTVAPQQPCAGETRERLLQALERLLERGDHRRVTAQAVTREAGLAHGTFYRYFKDRADALAQALERIAGESERLRGEFAALALGSREEERARLRARCESLLRSRSTRSGLLRTWFALSTTDPRIARLRQEKVERAVADWTTYLDALRARGFVDFSAASRDIAVALLAMLEASIRRAAVDENALGEREIAATGEVIERAVFGDPDA